jgi:hypothetical protein
MEGNRGGSTPMGRGIEYSIGSCGECLWKSL